MNEVRFPRGWGEERPRKKPEHGHAEGIEQKDVEEMTKEEIDQEITILEEKLLNPELSLDEREEINKRLQELKVEKAKREQTKVDPSGEIPE